MSTTPPEQRRRIRRGPLVVLAVVLSGVVGSLDAARPQPSLERRPGRSTPRPLRGAADDRQLGCRRRPADLPVTTMTRTAHTSHRRRQPRPSRRRSRGPSPRSRRGGQVPAAVLRGPADATPVARSPGCPGHSSAHRVRRGAPDHRTVDLTFAGRARTHGSAARHQELPTRGPRRVCDRGDEPPYLVCVVRKVSSVSVWFPPVSMARTSTLYSVRAWTNSAGTESLVAVAGRSALKTRRTGSSWTTST